MRGAAGPPEPGRTLVELRDLRKSYVEGDREHLVLRGVDATVRRGELVVLLGPSGSGKSTLLNVISGIDLPTSGDVRIDGVSIPDLDERDRTLFRRRRLGFVFQFFNLIPTLTVEENVLLPLELTGSAGAGERERAVELLEGVGLADRRDAFPDRLSGGERQRVAVVRALAHDPDLVLADEPTGNLDAVTGGRVLDLLEGLVRREGRTLLLVTHSREIARRADRVVALRDGVVVPDPDPGAP